MKPVYILTLGHCNTIFNIILPSMFRFSHYCFHSDYLTKTWERNSLLSTRSTITAHSILLDSVTLIIFLKGVHCESYFNTIFNIIFPSMFRFSHYFFHSDYLTKTWERNGLWSMRSTSTAHPILLDSVTLIIFLSWSQWPRSLRRRSAAARLLRSWVRIPPGHGCLSVVSVVCCQVEVSATS